MNIPKYQLSAERSLMVFEFISIGTKGRIPKLIKFSETNTTGIYNLAFGDKDSESGEIDDLALSGNGDSEKVLATIVSAVYAFTDAYEGSWVYARGSTSSRTRLYQMGINKFLEEATIDFDIYGLIENKWMPFDTKNNFEAFLVKRKTT